MGMSPGKIGSLAGDLFNIRADASKFLIIFDNSDFDLGAWSKASGLGVTWDACEHRVGSDMDIWIAPGPPKYSKISLSRSACVDSRTVQKWLRTTQEKPRLFSGALMLMSPIGLPLVEWELKEFFPTGWRIGDFDSKAANVVIETLELSHTGFIS